MPCKCCGLITFHRKIKKKLCSYHCMYGHINIIVSTQVCLISQSWDDVANIHVHVYEVLTVSSHARRKSDQYHLPSCMSTTSTVRMRRRKQYELWTYYCVEHTLWYAMQFNSSCLNSPLRSMQWRHSRSARMSNLPPDYWQAWRRRDLLSRPLEMYASQQV